MIFGTAILIVAFVYAVFIAVDYAIRTLDDGAGHPPSEWERR
jgi:hypothetical protein